MKTIAQEWDAFAAAVSETRRDEMRKAFYAGAWAMFNWTQELGEVRDGREAYKLAHAMELELTEFNRL